MFNDGSNEQNKENESKYSGVERKTTATTKWIMYTRYRFASEAIKQMTSEGEREREREGETRAGGRNYTHCS
jgi:hypothetical protein